MNFLADHLYALEVQELYAAFIINGIKTIETRSYPFPDTLIGCTLLIMQSQQGRDGISSLPDVIDGGECTPKLSILGTVLVKECFKYTSQEEWSKDRHLHLVPVDSHMYNWSPDDAGTKYGWKVEVICKYDSPRLVPFMTRTYRSLFDCGKASSEDLIKY